MFDDFDRAVARGQFIASSESCHFLVRCDETSCDLCIPSSADAICVNQVRNYARITSAFSLCCSFS